MKLSVIQDFRQLVILGDFIRSGYHMGWLDVKDDLSRKIWTQYKRA